MITLVLGGARSGKSAVAERLCGDGPVVYVATAEVEDADMAARVAAHQARRPPGWSTVEAGGDLAGALRGAPAAATVLVDSLTTWLARLPGFDADAGEVCAALAARPGPTVVVSDEVGLGVHPSSEAGRLFRDRLGELNQAVAAVADRALLVVAGRVLALDGNGR
jgi:adenosylcobinamide kinase / adenosylcobinamide-phosphate guanylyltransferase